MRRVWWMCRDVLPSRNDVYPSRRAARIDQGCEWCADRHRCKGPLRLRVENERGE